MHLLPSRLYCRFRSFTGSALTALADFTAGGEFRPALKILFSSLTQYHVQGFLSRKGFCDKINCNLKVCNTPITTHVIARRACPMWQSHTKVCSSIGGAGTSLILHYALCTLQFEAKLQTAIYPCASMAVSWGMDGAGAGVSAGFLKPRIWPLAAVLVTSPPMTASLYTSRVA